MEAGTRSSAVVFSLAGKTRHEIAAVLAGADREKLLDLVFLLTSFEHCLTPGRIAEATCCNKREVVADMKAGRFVDPIFGRGFFCRGRNSFRVTVTAAHAWRRSFFVPAGRSYTDEKKDPGRENGVTDQTSEQRRADRQQLAAGVS